jgi:hypothetical protein
MKVGGSHNDYMPGLGLEIRLSVVNGGAEALNARF